MFYSLSDKVTYIENKFNTTLYDQSNKKIYSISKDATEVVKKLPEKITDIPQVEIPFLEKLYSLSLLEKTSSPLDTKQVISIPTPCRFKIT
jgi:hypothetical protein